MRLVGLRLCAGRACRRRLSQWTVGDDLSKSKRCDPYELGGKPLSRDEAEALRSRTLKPWWKLAEDPSGRLLLAGELHCPSYAHCMRLVQTIGNLAQNDNHVPKLVSVDGPAAVVRVELSTHRLRGLSHSDFLMAFKIDPFVHATSK